MSPLYWRDESYCKNSKCRLLQSSEIIEDMLPWQIKSTRILIKTPFKMHCPATICSGLRGVNSSLCVGHFCT